MHHLDNDIIKTLCYADIFDFPLREDEIYRRLISTNKSSLKTIQKRLTTLHQNGQIKQTGPYFFLKGRASIVKKRQLHHQYSEQKILLGKEIAEKIARLPYVKAIFLTGATAVGNATSHDDIDIMIVSAARSLWTCRLFAVIWLELMGKRRRPNAKQTMNKVCLNLMVTTDSLSVSSPMQNLYTAHEVMQVKPLYDREDYGNKFLNENRWINQFLPNYFIPPPPPAKMHQNKQAPQLLETIFRQFQQWYMWSKRTREVITPHAAYFHPRDTGHIVLAKLDKRLKQYT